MRFTLIGLVVFKVVVTNAQFSFPYFATGATANTLLTGLVAYYNLNEATAASSATDSSGNGNTLLNTANPTTGTGLLAGDRVGNGTTQLFSGSQAGFNFGDQDFTICGFINLASTTGTLVPFSRYNSTSNMRSYLINVTSSQLRFGISPDGITVNTMTNSLVMSTGTWYFIAVRYNAAADLSSCNVTPCSESTLRAWESFSYSGGCFAASTAKFALMANASGAAFANFWNGQLDEVAVWSVYKSDADMNFNFNAGVPLGFSNYH